MKNEINQAHEASEVDSDTSTKRKVVVPGEIIVTGEDYLPGEGTKRQGDDIIATRFGLGEEVGRVVRVISIFGDNRDVTPKNVADRVIMGYLYPTIDQLEIGIKALKNINGGWIHFHIGKPLNKLKYRHSYLVNLRYLHDTSLPNALVLDQL